MALNPVIHTLSNGAKVIVTSPGHGFKFSDGTECGPQVKEVCDALTCERTTKFVDKIGGMSVNETRMVLPETGLHALGNLCLLADIVLVPFPVLTALREQGVRQSYPNALAMNATPDTQRSTPSDKVIDIENWSY